MTKEKPHIELRHDAINELLGSAPGWLVRWGITVFFAVIVTLLVGAYFFRYPVVVRSPVVITTEQPAIWVVAQSSGKIDSIYVENGSLVNKNQVLAIIDNSAKTEDVFVLEKELDSIKPYIKAIKDLNVFILSQQLIVGELQDSYLQLLKTSVERNVFVEERYHLKKIESLELELRQQLNHLQNLEKQTAAFQRGYDIALERYLRDSVLYKQNITPVIEFEETKKQIINSEIQFRQSQSVISSTKIEIARIEQGIVELKSDFRTKQELLNKELASSYELLCRNLLIWKEKYLLKAPLAGRVSFMNFWGSNQYINTGERSFAIVPQNSGRIIGKCNVPTNGLGKIEKEQKVTVKLDEFPYMEYGMLQGKVNNISLVSAPVSTPDGATRVGLVEVVFENNNLITTYKKEIPFTGELSGIAEIATEDISLIEHLINPLKHLWSRRK